MKIWILVPPFRFPDGPDPLASSMAAALRSAGHNALQVDLNVDAANWLLSEEFIAECRQKLQAEFEALEKAATLRPEDQPRYETLLGALALAPHAAGRVEAAKRTLRSREQFFDLVRYQESMSIIAQSWLVMADAYPPLGLGPAQLGDRLPDIPEGGAKNVFEDVYQERLVNPLLRDRPDLIAVGIAEPRQIAATLTALRMIKRHRPEAHVTLFGPLAPWLALSPRVEMLFAAGAYSILAGPAIQGALKLADALHHHRSLGHVPDLVLNDGADIVRTPAEAPAAAGEPAAPGAPDAPEVPAPPPPPAPGFDEAPFALYFTPDRSVTLPVTRETPTPLPAEDLAGMIAGAAAVYGIHHVTLGDRPMEGRHLQDILEARDLAKVDLNVEATIECRDLPDQATLKKWAGGGLRVLNVILREGDGGEGLAAIANCGCWIRAVALASAGDRKPVAERFAHTAGAHSVALVQELPHPRTGGAWHWVEHHIPEMDALDPLQRAAGGIHHRHLLHQVARHGVEGLRSHLRATFIHPVSELRAPLPQLLRSRPTLHPGLGIFTSNFDLSAKASHKPGGRLPDLLRQQTHLVVNHKTGDLFGVSSVVAALIEECDGAQDLKTIVHKVARHTGAPLRKVEEDCSALFHDLYRQQLVDLEGFERPALKCPPVPPAPSYPAPAPSQVQRGPAKPSGASDRDRSDRGRGRRGRTSVAAEGGGERSQERRPGRGRKSPGVKPAARAAATAPGALRTVEPLQDSGLTPGAGIAEGVGPALPTIPPVAPAEGKRRPPRGVGRRPAPKRGAAGASTAVAAPVTLTPTPEGPMTGDPITPTSGEAGDPAQPAGTGGHKRRRRRGGRGRNGQGPSAALGMEMPAAEGAAPQDPAPAPGASVAAAGSEGDQQRQSRRRRGRRGRGGGTASTPSPPEPPAAAGGVGRPTVPEREPGARAGRGGAPPAHRNRRPLPQTTAAPSTPVPPPHADPSQPAAGSKSRRRRGGRGRGPRSASDRPEAPSGPVAPPE